MVNQKKKKKKTTTTKNKQTAALQTKQNQNHILRLRLNAPMLTGVTPACFLLKIVYVDAILFLQGRLKKIDTLLAKGDIDWK